MRILLWHVHGSWTNAFVQGRHDYLLPVLPGRPADGLGRARTWDWPPTSSNARRRNWPTTTVDVVVLQRSARGRAGRAVVRPPAGARRPGRLPRAQRARAAPGRQPAPDGRRRRPDRARHALQPAVLGLRRSRHPGDRARHRRPGRALRRRRSRTAPAWSNEPERRGRTVGTDLLVRFTDLAPVDCSGWARARAARRAARWATCRRTAC